jgi:CRISPR-associated protein Csm1
MDEVAKRELIIAALFHDIGKFYQRTGLQHDTSYNTLSSQDFGFNGAHAKWSADFLRTHLHSNRLEDLVLYHHNPTKAKDPGSVRIIQEADHLSSAMDRIQREGYGEVDKEPLKSVFPQIHFSSDTAQVPADIYYPLTSLGITNTTFPGGKSDGHTWKLTPAYEKLWREFVVEFGQLGKDPSVLTLLYLLKKYTSLMPSAAYRHEPDIPLYDHVKTTAAISLCLALGDTEKPFLLIQGDLSGIQSFIFDVASPDEARKRMAKRLRGRSFWLSLLMDAVAAQIVKDLDLSEPCILWNTGGNLLILAPNTSDAKEKIAGIRKTVNQGLLDSIGGVLFLALESLACTKEEIRKFSDTRTKLAQLTNAQKRQKFIECEISFLPRGGNADLARFCNICGAPIPIPGAPCESCRQHEDLGEWLARARFMIRGSTHSVAFHRFGLDSTYGFFTEPKIDPGSTIFWINDTDFIREGYLDCGFLFIGNTVPLDTSHGGILSFGEMAHLAKGAPKLGVLKADVDNLGKIFSFGLPEQMRSISRIHTMSIQLQWFFSGYLNTLCREFMVYPNLCDQCSAGARKITFYEYTEDTSAPQQRTFFETKNPCPTCARQGIPKVYIVFSGGDDLLIVGAYDAIIELAGRMQEDFRKYTCENPDITISAGIALVNPQLPVSRAVQAAQEQLDTSKNEGKNRISLFDECIPWRDGGYSGYEKGYYTLMSVAKKMENAVNDKTISKGFVYSMLTLWEKTYRDCVQESHSIQVQKRISRKRYLPQLKYMMARTIRKDRDEIEQLVTPVFPWIKIPVYWTSIRSRK